MKHIQLFESFINERNRFNSWMDVDSQALGKKFMREFRKPKDWKNSHYSELEDWMIDYAYSTGIDNNDMGWNRIYRELEEYLLSKGYSASTR